MGGSAAGRITSGGSGIIGTTLGANGGIETVAIAQANLPNVNFNVTIPAGQGSHTHPINLGYTDQASVGSGGVKNDTGVSTQSATLPAMTGTAASGGSGTAVNNMPPAIMVNYILRIL
jgi:microcystin-dependent protein